MIHFSITILQYWHNTVLQYTWSLPSSPKRTPDHFTTSLSQFRRGRAGSRFVSVSSPLASSILSSKVSEFTRAPRSWTAVGPRRDGRDRQRKQKLGGWLYLRAPNKQRNRITEGKVSHLPLPQLSPKRLTVLWYQKSISVMKDSHPIAHANTKHT